MLSIGNMFLSVSIDEEEVTEQILSWVELAKYLNHRTLSPMID